MSASLPMRGRDVAILGLALATIYVPLALFPAPDVRIFLAPWLLHIRAAGPIAAFASPFSNYTPPYLYLLAIASLLPVPGFAAIKLLSIAGAIWLALAFSRLAKALGSDPKLAAIVALALPTVTMNSALLGQADGFWTGFALLAVASAIDGKPTRMALAAAIAFAFKAQAAFLAPFCLAVLIQRKAWPVILVPPVVYLAAMAPAAIAGWPVGDLLTIYLHQADFAWVGDAPNLWALAHLALPSSALAPFYPIGYAAAAGAALYLATRRRLDSLDLALLSALLLPFVLPKMLGRFFFLGDCLGLAAALSRKDPRSIAIAVLVETGSAVSLISYLTGFAAVNAGGALLMAAAVALALDREGLRLRNRGPDDPALAIKVGPGQPVN